MEKKMFVVPNIGCDNCIRTIQSEVGQLSGVKLVEGDVMTKLVTVEWDPPATWPQIVKTLADIEYAPAEA